MYTISERDKGGYYHILDDGSSIAKTKAHKAVTKIVAALDRHEALERRPLVKNQLELATEALECIHMWLDDIGAPREGEEGTLSIIGRIKQGPLKKTDLDAFLEAFTEVLYFSIGNRTSLAAGIEELMDEKKERMVKDMIKASPILTRMYRRLGDATEW